MAFDGAFAAGRDAAARGEDEYACPNYQGNTDLTSAWFRGWQTYYEERLSQRREAARQRREETASTATQPSETRRGRDQSQGGQSPQGSASIETARQIVALGSAILVARDGTYLGRVTNEFDPESIGNNVGIYGSEIAPNSIQNRIGLYGSEIGPQSAYNDITPTPPVLVIDGRAVAYVTTNKLMTPSIHPDILLIAVRGE